MDENTCCPLQREIRVLNLLPKIKISISRAHFSDVEFEADCFQQNRSKEGGLQDDLRSPFFSRLG